MFTYYFYDDLTDFVFYSDRNGNHESQKNVFSVERKELAENPIFESVYRQYFFNRDKSIVKRVKNCFYKGKFACCLQPIYF